MAREQTLLDRIGSLNKGKELSRSQSASEDLEALMESVRASLKRLLNARHGMCEAQPDYGLPALNDLAAGGGEHVDRVKKAIETAVQKYEPRLKRVRVSPVENEDIHGRIVSFRIDATLIARSGDQRVWYETSIADGREFDVID
jgi:type VI secretion system protein